MTFVIRVDTASLNSLIENLGDKAEAAARPAAFAASDVLYREIKKNVMRIDRVTGNLQNGIYQVFSRSNSSPGRASYHISWNGRRAPHGGLVEFGHIQRYVAYVGSDGNYYTAIRPEMRGKPRPTRRASQSVKDAYYVTLPTPKQVAAQPFVRPAMAKFPQAGAAAKEELLKALT